MDFVGIYALIAHATRSMLISFRTVVPLDWWSWKLAQEKDNPKSSSTTSESLQISL